MSYRMPDFKDTKTLIAHISSTMSFYHPRCIDHSGGFFHYFKDDGTIYDTKTRHLVSSARFVFNYAKAYRETGKDEYLEMTRHGVEFLRKGHRDARSGNYAWIVSWNNGSRKILDNTNHCYGLAFVLLAYAHAMMAGVEEAGGYLREVYDKMNLHFWDSDMSLYADQAPSNWETIDPYRGQNANMHACEALLAAFQATSDRGFIERASRIAYAVTNELAQQADGFIWEHYDQNWKIDWNYNLDDKANLFRPWGFQPGHFTEWAKLLVMLDRKASHIKGDTSWMIPTAERLYQNAFEIAWDKEHGGLCYGFAPDRTISDGDKYFWVQAETFAAAALLADRTGNQRYWDDYEQIWRYSWTHMIDHHYGAWFRILTQDNQKSVMKKSCRQNGLSHHGSLL